MKTVLGALAVLFVAGFAQASPTEDLRIAHGGGENCIMKAFMATDPSEAQEATCHEIGAGIKKVFEDNKQAITDAAHAFMGTMMQHPIPLEEATTGAHTLAKAVHPVQAAMFSGVVNLINVLTVEQRDVFNQAMKACEHE